MCGDDYVNCYRNRTDIMGDTYNTSNTAFDNSMNKVNGVLDYTIVLGLCLDTVESASVCKEHLAIESTKVTGEKNADGWNAGSVSGGWLNSAQGLTVSTTDRNVIDGCTCSKCKDQTIVKECGSVDSKGNVYDTDHKANIKDYQLTRAAETIFQEVLSKIEREAQSQYNSKLNKEMRMCNASNSGGILAGNDMNSTFDWVKLKSTKVPTNYSVAGLSSSQFVPTNDLYGSFCRVRVTLQSDDKKIQDAMKNKSWNTTYFAVGDSFTCGSWIPEKDLDAIAQSVAADKTGLKEGGKLTNGQGWAVAGATVLSAIGGAVGGAVLGENLRTGKTLSGLTGWTNQDKKGQLTKKGYAKKCVEYIEDADSCDKNTDFCLEQKKEYIGKAEKAAKNAGVDSYTADIGTFTCAEDGNPQSKVKCYINNSNGNPWTYYPSSAKDKITKLKSECSRIANAEGSLTEEVDDKHEWVTGVTTAATTVAGAALGGIATAQVIKASNRAQLSAAQQEWMDEVGRHITCYIGGDEAGSYGDIITTSLE